VRYPSTSISTSQHPCALLKKTSATSESSMPKAKVLFSHSLISCNMSEIKHIEPQQETQLYNDVCQIIDGARGRIATYVNTEACLTNWYVGKRIKEDVLYNKRAEYGKQVVKNLSVKLTERYGSGWGYEKLKHCVRSAYLFSEEEIRYATRTQLNWTHLRSLMGIKDPLERQFYVSKSPDPDVTLNAGILSNRA